MSLDIILREESNGNSGVRDLMFDLSKKHGAQKAFKDAEIIDEIVKMTYPAVGTFFKNHVQGTYTNRLQYIIC
jgi:predicted metalloprotease with PDZ domain